MPRSCCNDLLRGQTRLLLQKNTHLIKLKTMLDSSTIKHCFYGKTPFKHRDKWQLGTEFPLILEPNSQQGIWKSPIWLFALDCQILLLRSFSDEHMVLAFTTNENHKTWKERGHYRQFTITVGWKCYKCAPLLSSGMNSQQHLPKTCETFTYYVHVLRRILSDWRAQIAADYGQLCEMLFETQQ